MDCAWIVQNTEFKIKNMTYEFRTEDEFEAKILVSASDNYNMLWELKMNFHRRFKNVENSSDFHKGMYHVLDELQKEIEDFKE